MKQAWELHAWVYPGENYARIFTPWGESVSVPAEQVPEAREGLHQAHEQGPCLRCGHTACVFCLNWCDVVGADCPCDDRQECVYE